MFADASLSTLKNDWFDWCGERNWDGWGDLDAYKDLFAVAAGLTWADTDRSVRGSQQLLPDEERLAGHFTITKLAEDLREDDG